MKRNQFGTFGGVFTPCILTILGVIMFMRAHFVVGQAGVINAVAILFLACAITFLTALSTSGIGTNMRVRGGGAYFLISRVLGAEYGGAIGVVLFLALAVSVPFYVLGFTEALVRTFPGLGSWYIHISLGTAVLLFVVAFVGAGWAIRVQYVIMAVLFAAVALFLGGGLAGFSADTFKANLFSEYTPIDSGGAGGGSYSFWILFAIYFPAVTGIMAGINMSGDLEDPAKAIPRGTLAAIAIGLAVYLLQIVLGAGAHTREALLERPFLSLKDQALFNAGWLVTAGMFAASLSSALGSFMGAPRVLQALARDGILPVARPFAQGSAKGDEPRRALVLTGVLTLAVLLWASLAAGGGAFNLVAGVITMFFLCTYGLLNVAAFIEGLGENPSFRPQFRFFHWLTALAGALGCAAVAFVINPWQAGAAVAFLAAIMWYIKRRELTATFGDAWRGFLYKNVRNDLIRLSRMPETPKNWRPTCLVFSGNPETRETLVRYGGWFEGDRGLVFLAEVLVGTFEDYAPRRGAAVERLHEFCRKYSMEAFPVVVIDESLEHGMSSVIQALQVGPIRPNLMIFGWPGISGELAPVAGRLLRMAQSMGMALCLVQPGGRNPGAGPRRIDVWWRGMANGGLMLLLAHLLRSNWEWHRAEIRLIRLIPQEEGRESTREDLQKLIARARVEAVPHVVVAQLPFAETLESQSSGADCVFLGFELPPEGEESDWAVRGGQLLLDGPATVFIASAGTEDLLA